MKYLKMTFQYMTARKFFLPTLYVFLPAALIAGFAPLPLYNELVRDGAFVLSFFEIYRYVSGFDSGWRMLAALLTILFGAAAMSYVSNAVSRDMHVGDYKLGSLKKSLNNDFMAYFVACFFAVFGAQIIFVLTALLINLLSMIFAYEVTMLIFTIIILVVSSVVLVVCLALILTWPAVMIHTGVKPAHALANSLRLKKSMPKVVWAILLPVLIYQVLYVLIMLIPSEILGRIFVLALNTLLITFFFVYLSVLTNVVYRDAAGLEREDLVRKSKNIWKKK